MKISSQGKPIFFLYHRSKHISKFQSGIINCCTWLKPVTETIHEAYKLKYFIYQWGKMFCVRKASHTIGIRADRQWWQQLQTPVHPGCSRGPLQHGGRLESNFAPCGKADCCTICHSYNKLYIHNTFLSFIFMKLI